LDADADADTNADLHIGLGAMSGMETRPTVKDSNIKQAL
jgi:hypothetical protein